MSKFAGATAGCWPPHCCCHWEAGFNPKTRRLFGSGAVETSAGLQNASGLASIWRVPAIRRDLDAHINDELAADKLPSALLQRLGNEGAGIFPYELTYAAVNPIRYQPFPISQSYSAYTTYLDNWNAAAVASTGAPSRIVFEWEAIDERHPLLDVPAMSLELLRRYELDSAYDGVLLLRRRLQPAFQITRQIASTTLRIAEPFRVPDSEQPLIARIHLRYTPGGRFRRFAFRIPEVRVLIHTAAGRTLSARVPPEVLDNGIPLNLLPLDLNDFQTLISGQRIDPVHSLTIGGEGARYFEPNVSAELLEIADWTLQPAAPPVALHSRGSLDSIQVETINETSAAGRGEVIPIRDRYGFVQIKGWALDGLRGQDRGRGPGNSRRRSLLRAVWNRAARRGRAAALSRVPGLGFRLGHRHARARPPTARVDVSDSA